MFQDEPIMNLQQFVNNYLDITSLKDEFQNYVIAILKDEESWSPRVQVLNWTKFKAIKNTKPN